jgi:hypothetical protein
VLTSRSLMEPRSQVMGVTYDRNADHSVKFLWQMVNTFVWAYVVKTETEVNTMVR